MGNGDQFFKNASKRLDVDANGYVSGHYLCAEDSEMKKLPCGTPSESELETRIEQHMSWGNTEVTALIWLGYLNALLEWGLIDVDCHERLANLLPDVGRKELVEMMLGSPLSVEQQAEIKKKRIAL